MHNDNASQWGPELLVFTILYTLFLAAVGLMVFA
jgi:hypothetical protein